MKKTTLIFSLLPALMMAQGVWVQKSNFAGTAREKPQGFAIGTKGYVQGGTTGGTELWEWDQATDTWTPRAGMSMTRSFGIGFSVGQKGYVACGSTTAPDDCWEYDPAGDTWTQKANYGGPGHYGSQAFVIGSLGYIIGGSGSAGNQLWEFDPAANSWTQRANFGGNPVYWGVGFAIGTKGYHGTGYDAVNRQDFWEWDQASNSWTQKANFTNARRAAVGFSIAGKGYIGAGYDTQYLEDWWEYDPTGNAWTQVANFGGGLSCCHTTFVIGSKGYVATGYAGGGSQMMWEYAPGSVSIEEVNESNFLVAPNPASDHFLLNFQGPVRNGWFELLSSEGKTIRTQVISGLSEMKVNRDGLAAGVYFCRVKEGNALLGLKKVIFTD